MGDQYIYDKHGNLKGRISSYVSNSGGGSSSSEEAGVGTKAFCSLIVSVYCFAIGGFGYFLIRAQGAPQGVNIFGYAVVGLAVYTWFVGLRDAWK